MHSYYDDCRLADFLIKRSKTVVTPRYRLLVNIFCNLDNIFLENELLFSVHFRFYSYTSVHFYKRCAFTDIAQMFQVTKRSFFLFVVVWYVLRITNKV